MSSRVIVIAALALLVGVVFARIMRPHYEWLALPLAVGSAVAEPLFGLAIMGIIFMTACDVAAFYAIGQGGLGFRSLARCLLGYPKPLAGTVALRHIGRLVSFLAARKRRILLLLLPQVLPVAGFLHYWLTI